MKEVGFDTTMHDPRRILNRISRARNDLITADQFRRKYEENVGDLVNAVVYEVFPEYEQQILNQNSVDFDALLLHVVDMLSENEELREYLDLQFQFVLVDEYQDTNLAQYRIVQALSQKYANLCVTGDPDQSIYGWRGARPENIVQFERDFATTEIVSLDQNFRSTAAIVRCADQLISRNPRRHRNPLYTDNEEGVSVRLRIYSDAETEAGRLAAEISQSVQSGQRRYSDFAIFYRVNVLSRPVETALSRYGVPFQVASGFSFYERAEVRDLLGYLRLLENPADDVALGRVINRPARGIGAKTVARLTEFARQHGISLLQAVDKAAEIPSLTARSRKPLKAFADLCHKLQEQAQSGMVANLIERLIAETDYLSLWKDENDEVDQDRVANVYELVSAARLYEHDHQDPDDPPSLQGFLELASLTSEVDNVDGSMGAVTLMTMHAAKGLEFPVVFILGLESGLIPHDRAVHDGDPASFQEERRLLFVAATRAMQELNFTHTRQRDFRGTRRYTIASPFLPEMDLEVESDSSEPLATGHLDSQQNDHVQQARRRYELAQQQPDQPRLMSASDLEKKLAGLKRDDTGSCTSGSAVAHSGPHPVVSSIPADRHPGTTGLDERPGQSFVPGSSVLHPDYGRGVVVEISEGSRRATVTVLFEADDRRQTFVAAHCPLQLVGNTRPK